MTEGVDYSFARPGGAALVAAGKQFAMRYVPYAGDGGKGLTKDELADLFAHGIDVGLVWETTAGRAKAGRAAGAADATRALAGARGLGFPSRPIYFAVDFQALSGDMPAIRAYLDGAASVLGRGRVGVYGSDNVVDAMHSVGAAEWFWQTYAWSGGRLSPRAHLYQYRNAQRINGGSVDFCRALVDDFGQWAASPAAQPQGEPVYDIDVQSTTAVLVDIPAGAEILNADGSGRMTAKETRSGVISPCASTTAKGSRLRLVVWTEPDPQPDLLLAVYVSQVTMRPIATFDQAGFDAAMRVRVNAAVEHIDDAATALKKAIEEARIR